MSFEPIFDNPSFNIWFEILHFGFAGATNIPNLVFGINGQTRIRSRAWNIGIRWWWWMDMKSWLNIRNSSTANSLINFISIVGNVVQGQRIGNRDNIVMVFIDENGTNVVQFNLFFFKIFFSSSGGINNSDF